MFDSWGFGCLTRAAFFIIIFHSIVTSALIENLLSINQHVLLMVAAILTEVFSIPLCFFHRSIERWHGDRKRSETPTEEDTRRRGDSSGNAEKVCTG